MKAETYLDAQAGSFKIFTMPKKHNQNVREKNEGGKQRRLHVIISIFGISLAAEFDKSVTAGVRERRGVSLSVRCSKSKTVARAIISTDEISASEVRTKRTIDESLITGSPSSLAGAVIKSASNFACMGTAFFLTPFARSFVFDDRTGEKGR